MDVTGKRILILGDSLTHRGARSAPDGRNVTESSTRDGTPGDLLASKLLEAGASWARINGRVSRSAWNFFRVEDGDKILAAEAAREPDVVFVFLGTNDLGLDAGKDAAAFTTIRDAFPNAEVWSIGPPTFSSEKRTTQAETVYKTLRAVFGADRVIDLRPLTDDVDRTTDGVHFPASSARIVAARLANAITDAGSESKIALLVRRPWFAPVGVSLGASVLFVGLAWIIRRRRRLLR